MPLISFNTPRKHQKAIGFFRGYQKRSVAWNGLRCYIWKWRDHGSNPTRYSAGLWDLTSLGGFPLTLGRTRIKCIDLHWVSEATPSTVTESWAWGSKIAVKKITLSWWKSYKNQSINYHIKTNPLICSPNQWTGFYGPSSWRSSRLFACIFWEYWFISKNFRMFEYNVLNSHLQYDCRSFKTEYLIRWMKNTFRWCNT